MAAVKKEGWLNTPGERSKVCAIEGCNEPSNLDWFGLCSREHWEEFRIARNRIRAQKARQQITES